MSWMTEHAPQVFGGFLFLFIVYSLVNEMMNQKE